MLMLRCYIHTQDKNLEVQACAHIQWADVESPNATTSTTTPQDERTEMERRPVLRTATDSQNLPINVPKEGLKLVPGAVGRGLGTEAVTLMMHYGTLEWSVCVCVCVCAYVFYAYMCPYTVHVYIL